MWNRRCASAWRRSASAFRFIEQGRAAALAGVLFCCFHAAADPRTANGFARVNDSGHLIIAGREVALAGIEVPIWDRVCRRQVSPIRCAPSAVLVLDDMVRGFVHCEILGDRGAGLAEGRCTIAARRLLDDRLDLAAELLRQGWAFARDDAPGLYRSLERMARTREIGIWADAAIDWR
jgi:endonuclease YncB( thermonuclease family)